MREKILFDRGWLFYEGDIDCGNVLQNETGGLPNEKYYSYFGAKTERMIYGPASVGYDEHTDKIGEEFEMSCRWQRVDLPHDYVIRQTPCEKYNNARGFFDYKNAWYRKHFTLPAEDEGRRISLYFEGIATNAEVYLNGCLICRNFGSSVSFEADITDYARFGDGKENENVLAVYVDAKSSEGWWYEGGGIYRHVWLIKTDRISADLWGVYAPAKKISDGKWRVDFETTVRNDEYEAHGVKAESRIIAQDGKVIAKGVSEIYEAPERSKITLKYSADVENPQIWDVDSPVLYRVETDIYRDGVLCDTTHTRIGFREFVCDPDKGLILNGRHVIIKGICAHQDFGLTGKAVPDNIYRYRIKILKEMGANGYRTTHYAHSEQTMDALDEAGFIVMDECRRFESTEEGMKQLEMLVKRDRNRPSVFFWSIGNEEPYHLLSQGEKIAAAMRASVKKLDSTRPVTTAICNLPSEAKCTKSLDVIGINYNLNLYDDTRAENPGVAIFASECCATGTTRGWYRDDAPKRGYLPAYDRIPDDWFCGREDTWKFLRAREWVMGGYQWIGIEHRGEALWPRVCSQSGAIDLFLQKKDAFYQNLSHWAEYPVVHLLPHWNFEGEEGEIKRVVAYTNCEELELFKDGVSLGRKTIEKYGHGEWNVPYSAGKLLVIAYNGGTEVCRDEKATTGKPVKLALRLENADDIKANGADIALYTCYCIDEDGNEVPTAEPFVKFDVNSLGYIVGTGSSVSDHVPPHFTDRKMYAGKITVGVRLGETHGTLVLRAECETLGVAIIKTEI